MLRVTHQQSLDPSAVLIYAPVHSADEYRCSTKQSISNHVKLTMLKVAVVVRLKNAAVISTGTP
eukprot:1967-Heterococcus_DN1.PRE.1